jgi:hypothetical protein
VRRQSFPLRRTSRWSAYAFALASKAQESPSLQLLHHRAQSVAPRETGHPPLVLIRTLVIVSMALGCPRFLVSGKRGT